MQPLKFILLMAILFLAADSSLAQDDWLTTLRVYCKFIENFLTNLVDGLASTGQEATFELLKQSKDSPDQIVWSPASVGILMASLLASQAPKEQTEEEMRAVLPRLIGQSSTQLTSLESGRDFADKYVRDLMQDMTMEKSCDVNSFYKSTLCLANLLVLRENASIMGEFRNQLRDRYHFQLTEANPDLIEDKLLMINDWVNRSTEGSIPKLMDKNALKGNFQLVLINSIFVNATWLYPMKETPRTFHGSMDEKPILLSFLQASKAMPYYANEHEGYRVVQYPLTNPQLAFMLFLPRQRFQKLPYKLIESVPELLSLLDKRMLNTQVDLLMPQFSMESELNLNGLLKTMGMRKAFSMNANLTGIAPDLYVSEVKQRATIEVSKSGLKAAAATYMSVNSKSVSTTDFVKFHCNEPFAFALVDKSRKALLFFGEFNRPRITEQMS